MLPDGAGIARALELGYARERLIAMQGPFGYEINKAMLVHSNAAWLVTKESGSAGGYDEKLAAARDLGVRVITIGRPLEEIGFSVDDALVELGVGAVRADAETDPAECSPTVSVIRDAARTPGHSHFPLFVDVRGKRALVVGAGAIAGRRILTLSRFGIAITVVATRATGETIALAGQGRLEYLQREWRESDLEGADIVVVATDSRDVNREVGEAARNRGIPVSVADCKEESDFFFPAVISSGDVVVALTSSGLDHALVRAHADAIRALMMEKVK
jgi:precorrin-2 dehydrogenase/sirohydrochlorin ferrochelatase/precorrin-6A/cobalt-precorrin-6A reductase